MQFSVKQRIERYEQLLRDFLGPRNIQDKFEDAVDSINLYGEPVETITGGR